MNEKAGRRWFAFFIEKESLFRIKMLFFQKKMIPIYI